MEFINLTPHPITLHGKDGEVTIEPSGRVARVTSHQVEVGEVKVEGVTIPLYKTEYGEIENLPQQRMGERYIVSGLVRAQVPDRHDVASPTKFRRDDKGRIIGAEGLDVNMASP